NKFLFIGEHRADEFLHSQFVDLQRALLEKLTKHFTLLKGEKSTRGVLGGICLVCRMSWDQLSEEVLVST
ncbi:MAG: hypothetical protein ACRCT2_03360, partial [Plesiomonas shigelloides]